MSETLSKAIKDELAEDLNAVVAKAERFLDSASREGEGITHALRAQVERNLHQARSRLRKVEDVVTGKVRSTARAADTYVHDKPWQTVGAGAGLGVVLGVLIGVLLSHRGDRDE